jgi:hypothetical protein
MLLPDGVKLLFHIRVLRFLCLHEHFLLALGQDWGLKNANVNQFKHKLLYLPTQLLRIEIGKVFKVLVGERFFDLVDLSIAKHIYQIGGEHGVPVVSTKTFNKSVDSR